MRAPDANDTNPADRQTVESQIGRAPRAFGGVAARCVFGLPAVTRQLPVDEDGRPFPTGFYLTCPHLVRQVDRLEGAGGVSRWERRLAEDDGLRASVERADEEHGVVVGHGRRIAGRTSTDHLKCLHAHAAAALAGIDHPLGRAVLAEAAPTWCSDRRCGAAVDAAADPDEAVPPG